MPVTLKKQGSILLVAGLDVSKPAEYVSEQSCTACKNFRVDRSLLTKRYGTTERGSAIGGTDKEIMAGREFTREGTKYNVRIGRDNIEQYNTGSSAWVDISGTNLTGSTDDLIDTALPLLAGKRILCITNGINPIEKWTSSGNTSNLGGSPPVAKFIQEYATYLVCANIQGGTDVSQRVQWSDTASPETWTGGNSGSVDLTEDGEDITGLNVFGNFLCVHKKTSIYLGALVSSNSIFRFDRKNTEIGTIANGSIVNLPTGQQIFLALDGLRLFNGVSSPLIPSPVNDEIRDNLNDEYAHKAWGVLVIEEDEVWIGVPIGDDVTGDTVYKYNYKTGALYKDTRTNINACWRASTSAGLTWDELTGTWDSLSFAWDDGQLGTASGLIHFGSTEGNVYIQDITATADDGTAFECSWDSKDFEDELSRLCRWQELRLWARGTGDLIVEYSIDEGSTWTAFSNSPYTLSDTFPTDSSPAILYLDVISSRLRIRFRNSSTTSSIEIKQFVLGYTVREYR